MLKQKDSKPFSLNCISQQKKKTWGPCCTLNTFQEFQGGAGEASETNRAAGLEDQEAKLGHCRRQERV